MTIKIHPARMARTAGILLTVALLATARAAPEPANAQGGARPHPVIYTPPQALTEPREVVEEEEREPKTVNPPEGFDLLCRVVEAEAAGEPLEGKVMVASVVLNRVEAPGFPDSIEEVITQPRQFQPVSTGKIHQVEPSEETVSAVQMVLEEGSRTSALYFMNPDISDPGARKWMASLQYVVSVGNHDFYR